MDKIYQEDLQGQSNIYKTTPDYAKISGTPAPAPKPEPDPYGGHDYVEIAGIKWATMNVGAESITDYGLYFQWGDTQGYTASQVGSGEGKKYFSWDDYKFNPSGDGLTFTKYNSTDGKKVLDAEDDAVRANWGGNWRMPTKDEFVALGSATTSAWTNNYQSSGVAGLVLTDKTDSSKTLFFPACGFCGYGNVIRVGDESAYFSSQLYSNGVSSVFIQNFKSDKVSWHSSSNRFTGYGVRGVAE